MDSAKTFSKRALLWIFLVMALFVLAVDVAIYFGASVAAMKAVHTAADPDAAKAFSFVFENFSQVVVPVSVGAGLVFALLLWMIIRGLYVNAGVPEVAAAPKDEGPVVDPEVEKRNTRRTFLHLVSALQKEGRLIDFFNEDLSIYSDDQIGAAVRGIHENCVKTLGKYVSCGPVVDTPEGESITVEAGFNPEEIRLTGNVSGEPPFTGIVRHKGWKATKTEVPTLSEESNPDVLAPAEVELG
ncbi:DUF2760 domain-containing protein [Desulfoluna spongiiphila]|uniref:DUF2760 domain-containing protein n=1 Tax=Desulfoluna spongiiphila TaxID=419481 RepID=A0A1G5DA55_9BACT|nr:DUF2760 domain-containing protein [Desulfoluna spongiiphila]SCY11494.1 protein of unknown function [Desulfoluna spongiiphila]VVS95253.1 domain of unknown function duf2760 [Desulfoluna spongiiphila]